MSMTKRYDAQVVEPRLAEFWQRERIYDFVSGEESPVYAIDTPPATVSGNLHLGHVYSYTHADVLARFRRMIGDNVFYPMGFDDNGLPTERLVERRLGKRAGDMERSAFIRQCLTVSDEAEVVYRALWQRLGLSVDWRYTYRTIDEASRRMAQWSFLDLYRKGLAYRQQAPTIWCPECRTAIAQAELSDLERQTTFYTLGFTLADGASLPIATTRPELLPACVAVFVAPEDPRYVDRIGEQVTTPLGDSVPLLADPLAVPEKGTGAVMCCTFGDATDIEWWRTHHLPLRVILDRSGRLTAEAKEYVGLTTQDARKRIVEDMATRGLVLNQEFISQSVRVHERCDTPVEYLVTRQWFVRVLDQKERLLAAGEQVRWHPEQMGTRYSEWVEHLRWDWLISRQRAFGVSFPVWYCNDCGATLLAEDAHLPVDPGEQAPPVSCDCGSSSYTPELDVMDTWATSSLSPQIVGRWFDERDLYERVFPFALRPQAHEIIRTWAFYTIVQSQYHFGAIPWSDVAISGWGLAPEGGGKISKSRGSNLIAPTEVMATYSADAARYWATSTGFGKDSVINEEKIAAGARLVTKLWNVAKFSERFLADSTPPAEPPLLSPADRWLLARTQRLILQATRFLHSYEYAAAKSEVESFFWRDLADNYLEMAKERLYNADSPMRAGAVYTLRQALLTTLKLFAPFLPYITEAIYQELFTLTDGSSSIHRAKWPTVDVTLCDEGAEAAGETLIAVATAVRRYKSETNLSLGAELRRLVVVTKDAKMVALVFDATEDLRSVTRASEISVAEQVNEGMQFLHVDADIAVGVEL